MIDDVKPSSKESEQAKLDELDITNKQPAEKSTELSSNPAISETSKSSVDFTIDEQTADEEPLESSAPSTSPASKTDTRDHKSWKDKLRLHWPPGEKEWLTSGVIILGCGIIIAVVLSHTGSKPIAQAISKPVVKQPALIKPSTVPSTLSGLPVAAATNQQPVTGVMIENSDEARPQSGLSQAEVVFEAIAEGGITRFLALYQDTAPTNVGPIRSVRPYYLQWALGFDASIAHVGGSSDALNDITAWGVKDLNEFYNSSYYHRISSRQAPHNVYTSIADLQQLEAKKGYTTTNFTGFPRKSEDPSKTPDATSINLNISWSDYAVHYAYDSATNSYNRSEGGAPMVDANTGAQISPKVVIAMVVPVSQGALDTTGAYYSVYQDIGSGPVDVFQDGTVTTGTWTKTSATSQITFKTAQGQTIKLNPGQTWITAVGSSSLVSYSS